MIPAVLKNFNQYIKVQRHKNKNRRCCCYHHPGAQDQWGLRPGPARTPAAILRSSGPQGAGCVGRAGTIIMLLRLPLAQLAGHLQKPQKVACCQRMCKVKCGRAAPPWRPPTCVRKRRHPSSGTVSVQSGNQRRVEAPGLPGATAISVPPSRAVAPPTACGNR